MSLVQKSKFPLENIGGLPERYSVFHPFYKNDDGNSVIPKKFEGHIFAITTTVDSKEKILLYYYTPNDNEELKVEVKKHISKIISSYSNNKNKKFSCVLEFAEITNDKTRVNLFSEIKKKSETKRVSKNEDSRQSELISLADSLLAKAMKMKSSDLHIETIGEKAVIRFRIYKELIDIQFLSIEEAKELGNVFYSTFPRALEEDQEKGSGDGVYKSENLLDGEFSRNLKGSDISMKARLVNIGQNHDNQFNLVLRLIDKSKSLTTIPYNQAGFTPEACEVLKILQKASRGMVLVIGVTGSGKSTSIQNIIQHERDRSGNSRKIYLLEQPIEQKISRVTQINSADSHDSGKEMDPQQDYSFGNLNRMLMRGDPDSIGYGEIRDNVTAEAAIKGVESGHLVYGTMHASDAMGTFSRFETFKVPLEKLCRPSFIQLIMFQHLIPTLCPHCSIPYNGEDIPLEFGEFHAVKSFKLDDGRPLDIIKIMKIKNELPKGASLIRTIQMNRMIDAKEATKMRRKMEAMNNDSDVDSFKKRLNDLIRTSNTPKEKLNVRFRGDGCKHCHQGTNGVVPAVELLVPDENFLSMVQNKKISKAEAYWKARLRGRRAVQDTYSRILTGIVDPRMVESELDNIGT